MRALPTRLGLVSSFVLAAIATPAAHAQQGSIRGTVVDSAGAPIHNADVGIVALKRLTRTDDKGRFAITKLPPGNVELSVRRLSYEPQRIQVAVAMVETDTMRITMITNVALLNTITTSAGEVRQREMIEDFYRRLTKGVGQYIGREEIEKRWGGTPSDLLRNTSGIRFVRVGGGRRGIRFPTTTLSRRDCPPMIWIDGQKVPGMEIDEITLGDIEGIELYNGPATTPMQFSQGQGSNNCGTIVVWSRPPQYQRVVRKP
jgi:hypothetical protein